MPDREKVIKAYECCKNTFDRKCEKCPYEKDCCHDGIPMFVIKKMVALLKEQQQKKSKEEVLAAIISTQGYTDVETFKRTVLEIDNFEDYFLGGLFRAVKAVEKLFDEIKELHMDIEEYTKLCDRAIALIKEANEKLKDNVAFVAYIKFIKQLIDGMDGEQK